MKKSGGKSVSYTHLDVYKRQSWYCLAISCIAKIADSDALLDDSQLIFSSRSAAFTVTPNIEDAMAAVNAAISILFFITISPF